MTAVSGKGWVMHLGDCRTVIPSVGVVTHVATDPPYGFGSYATDRDEGLVVEALGLVKYSSSLSVFGYPEVLVAWCMALGKQPDEWVTWWPTNAAVKAGGRAKSLPRQTEHIAVFGPTPGAHELRHPRSFASCKKPQNVGLSADARLGDVWTDPSPGIAFNSHQRLHPNEKPVDLLLKLLRLVSKPSELVLDPFAGSGTTGVAALRLGRRFIGVELDPAFFELACERLRAEEDGSTLAAARAGQTSLFGRAG